MRRLSVVVVVLVASAGFAGCAARARPAVQAGAAEHPSATGGSLQEYMAKIRHLSETARPAPSGTPAAMLESRDAALAEALKEAQASPTAESLRRAGELYRQHGVLDAAYRYFNRVIQLNPRDAAAYDGLARVWRDWKLPELAMGDAHRAVYYAPQSAAAHNTLGTIMQALGQDEAARAAYELASTLDPKAAYAVNNLCYLSLLGGRIEAAIQKCRAALTVDPSLVAARNNLGLALAASGRMDLARTHFLDAEDRATGLYNTGIAYLASGDYEGALSAFDEASRNRPLFHLARERAQQIRARLFRQSHNLPVQIESEFER